jgi:CRAL/TRIO domain
VDRIGRPVLINRHYNLDANKLYECTTNERILKAHIRYLEKMMHYRLPACSAAKGEYVGQILLVLDCEGYPYLQFHRISSLIQKITRFSSDYYPETLGKIIIINAPWFFAKVWKLCEHFFDAGTQDKISIYGTDYYADCKQRSITLVQRDISPDNLPDFFGGFCKCDGAGGCEVSDVGPWKNQVLEKYNFKTRDSAVTLDVADA